MKFKNIQSFERLVDGLSATENTDVYVKGSNAYFLLKKRYFQIFRLI
jgi:hypothetical protein